MKFESTAVTAAKEILYNDDYAAVPHTFEEDANAGDVVDGIGVCLYDVAVDENPNGAAMYRGIIDKSKITDAQATAIVSAGFAMIKVFDPKTGEFSTATSGGSGD